MGDYKVQVCRLCFSLISDKSFYPIKSSLEDMLRVITSDVDLDKTTKPVMCQECSKVLEEIFTFKTNFFESEEVIETKMSDSSSGQVDLGEVMNQTCKRPTRNSKNISVGVNRWYCRTCLKAIRTQKFVKISKKITVLGFCIPEMDVKLIKDPLMCPKCYRTLQKMNIFKTTCLRNERKIDAFARKRNLGMFQKVNLHEVLQFKEEDGDISDIIVKKEPWSNVNECNEENDRMVDCSKYVLVKMEPSDDEEEKRAYSRKTSQSNTLTKSRTQNQPKKCNSKKLTYCTECDFKTMYKYNLRRHLIVTHKRKEIEVSKKFYYCPQCPFSTKWNMDLTRHMLSHVKPEALKCSKCPFSTNKSSQLIKHVVAHVNAEFLNKYRFMFKKK